MINSFYINVFSEFFLELHLFYFFRAKYKKNAKVNINSKIIIEQINPTININIWIPEKH